MPDQEQTERGASTAEPHHERQDYPFCCHEERDAISDYERELSTFRNELNSEMDRGASVDRLSKIKERLSDALCSGIFYGIIGGYDDVDARDDVDWIIGALERVTAELADAKKMAEVAQKATAHYIEQIEAERDAMREVCDLAPDALVILAGLHLGTTWELSPYVKDELARVTPLVRDALARLDATRKAAASAEERKLPTIEDMAGSMPDFTGGLSTAEYVREMRGEVE